MKLAVALLLLSLSGCVTIRVLPSQDEAAPKKLALPPRAPLKGPLEDAGVTLVPGTTSTWTDGTNTWAGNPFCAMSGMLLQPNSPAIDAGDKGCRHIDTYLLECINEVTGQPFQGQTDNCPNAGSSIGQPPLPNGQSCREWYGAAPDIGACEYVASGPPPPPPVCTVGNNSFTGCYYRGTNFDLLVLVRDDGQVNFDWVDGSPDGRVPVDQFSVVWESDFDFKTTSNYEFITTIDDGVRVYVDGSKIIESWQDQGATEYRGQIKLPAGVHRVRMEYYENGGQASAQLSWRALSTVPQPPSAITVK